MQVPAPARRVLSSGITPAVLVAMAAAVLVLGNDVSVRDTAAFAAYVVLGLVLPGLVLWRLLVPRVGTSLLADAVFGTTVALAVELVVYVCTTHVGHPGIARFWPVVPLALSLVPRWRRQVWRRGTAQPVWWSWSVGALVVVALVVVKQVAWTFAVMTQRGLSAPYVDFPYHLALVTGLSRNVRTDLPYLEGEPLYYHWFDHAHVAAERHATGIDPVVLLSRLDMLIPVVLVLLGSALIAQRVAKSPLAGLVAIGVLTLGGSAMLWPHFAPLFLTTSTYLSPTTPFGCAILTGCIAITIEILDRDDRPPPTAWIAAVLLIGASAGAKGTVLPVLIAGWVSVLLMALVLRRRVDWPVAGLVVLGAVTFVVAQRVIYGGTTQETNLLPFGVGNYLAADFGMVATPADGTPGLRTVLGTVYILIRVSCLAAVIGLFTPRVWRNSYAHFLVGSILGGIGASLLLDSATRNQLYFLLVTPSLVAIATGWGLVELLRRVSAPVAVRVCVTFLLVGAVTSAVLLWPLRPAGFSEGNLSLTEYLLQPLLVVGLMVLVWLAVRIVARGPRQVSWRHAAPLACVSTLIGLGLLTGPLNALHISTSVAAPEVPSTNPPIEIAHGGIPAARWLRDHSSPDTVVATNSHCRFPAPARCDHRAAWISAFAERQMLIEGWAYTSQTAERAAKVHVSTPFLSYWKHDLLMNNERAFWKPTRKRLDWLRDDHHVRWLFVDKRFRADLPALKRLADLRYDSRYYAVFRLR